MDTNNKKCMCHHVRHNNDVYNSIQFDSNNNNIHIGSKTWFTVHSIHLL